MKKILFAFIASALLLSSPTFAVVYEETTRIEIDEVNAYCYGEDSRDIAEYSFINYLDVNCTGTFPVTPPDNCLRELKLDTLDNKKSQLTVKILPTPIGLVCAPPASPANNVVWVKFAPDGDDGKSQTQLFDMNECWGWWCAGLSGYNQTFCPFDFEWLEPFGICQEYEIDINEAEKNCPIRRFDIPADVTWINVSWGWDSGNDWDVEFIINFIGFSTSKRIKVVETSYDELTKISATQDVFKGSIGSLMLMNANFLSIIYSIAEVTIIIVSVLMLPVITLLGIKYVFEKVTGRPLTFSRRRRR